MDLEYLSKNINPQNYLMRIRESFQQIQDYINQQEEVPKLGYIKMFDDVKDPERAYEDDLGLDIYAYSDAIYHDNFLEYKTGLIFEIPDGYDLLLYPRSSIRKYSLALSNSVAIIDTGYTSETIFSFRLLDENKYHQIYKKGEKIGQAVLTKKNKYILEERKEVTKITDRGANGFGSSGT